MKETKNTPSTEPKAPLKVSQPQLENNNNKETSAETTTR
jgi:hypothetical protein